jgi:hypothetical protein
MWGVKPSLLENRIDFKCKRLQVSRSYNKKKKTNLHNRLEFYLVKDKERKWQQLLKNITQMSITIIQIQNSVSISKLIKYE